MFAKIFTLFALLAVAFAAPEPKPAPAPQLLAYTAGVDYVLPAAGGIPSVVSPYGVQYAGLPAATVLVR